jgi:hypothetical protein
LLTDLGEAEPRDRAGDATLPGLIAARTVRTLGSAAARRSSSRSIASSVRKSGLTGLTAMTASGEQEKMS